MNLHETIERGKEDWEKLHGIIHGPADGAAVSTEGGPVLPVARQIAEALENIPDPEDGASAYDVAVAAGFVGTVEQWLASLIGPQGPQGAQGIQGPIGPQGEQGEAGEDAAPLNFAGRQIIYVSASGDAATDERAGLSPFDPFTPFATLQAAFDWWYDEVPGEIQESTLIQLDPGAYALDNFRSSPYPRIIGRGHGVSYLVATIDRTEQPLAVIEIHASALHLTVSEVVGTGGADLPGFTIYGKDCTIYASSVVDNLIDAYSGTLNLFLTCCITVSAVSRGFGDGLFSGPVTINGQASDLQTVSSAGFAGAAPGNVVIVGDFITTGGTYIEGDSVELRGVSLNLSYSPNVVCNNFTALHSEGINVQAVWMIDAVGCLRCILNGDSVSAASSHALSLSATYYTNNGANSGALDTPSYP